MWIWFAFNNITLCTVYVGTSGYLFLLLYLICTFGYIHKWKENILLIEYMSNMYQTLLWWKLFNNISGAGAS